MLVDGLARYLDGLGLVEFDELGIEGDCFIAAFPSAPDEIVVITPTGGPEGDFRLGYDSPTVQLRYRSTTDPRPALERAHEIHQALQSLGNVTLPDGTYVARVIALQSGPTSIGQDQNGRHEYTQNFEFHVRAASAHRE